MIELRPRLTPARVWWLAARPATLAASVSPVLVGTGVAVRGGQARPWAGLAALVVGIAMQLGVNYANDYSDFRRGADTPRRRGPVRAAASGVVPPAQVRAAALAAFAVAAAVGLVLSLATDWRLIGAGVLAVAAGWLYTGGPRPYGYVESGQVGPLALVGGVATGALACAILVLNNLRDIETDQAAGKRTLAVRLGAVPTRWMLAALLTVAFVAPVAGFGWGVGGRLVALPLLAVPLAWQVFHLSASDDPKVLVSALKRCAELEVWWSLLWTVGVLAW